MSTRRYATVRNATPADLAAAVESDPATSLDGTLTLLSILDDDPAAIFVGDGFPFAVLEYTAEERAVRVLMTDWTDWTDADDAAQTEMAKAVATKDLELGELLQGMVLAGGWKKLAATGVPSALTALMEQQLGTSYAAAATNNGALSLAAALITRIPDSVMAPAEKMAFQQAIAFHFLKWPRPTDESNTLPPQVLEKNSDFAYSVYVPGYIVDVAGGDVTITLPPLQLAGVLPYWPTWIKVINAGANKVIIKPAPPDTIEGFTGVDPDPDFEVTTNRTMILAGAAGEWKDLASS